MTLRLILTRHAKSSWDDPRQRDFDRPLNSRGRAAATAIGRWLRMEEIIPDEIISSSAARTLETAVRLGFDLEIGSSERLYHAPPDRMLDVLKIATGKTVLMIGHNPGIAEMAHMLVPKAPKHARFLDYPTGATLIAKFNIDSWDKVQFGQATAEKFIIPADLAE